MCQSDMALATEKAVVPSRDPLLVPSRAGTKGDGSKRMKLSWQSVLWAFLIVTGGLTGLISAENAQAGSLAAAAGRGAAKSLAARFAKPRDVVISRSRYPQSAAHVEHAQRMGQPTVLTLDRAQASKRRYESLRHIGRKENSPAKMDRDEYPPAMTREGGFNSNVRYIDRGDNRGAGKHMERQARGLPDGSRIRLLVGD